MTSNIVGQGRKYIDRGNFQRGVATLGNLGTFSRNILGVREVLSSSLQWQGNGMQVEVKVRRRSNQSHQGHDVTKGQGRGHFSSSRSRN